MYSPSILVSHKQESENKHPERISVWKIGATGNVLAFLFCYKAKASLGNFYILCVVNAALIKNIAFVVLSLGSVCLDSVEEAVNRLCTRVHNPHQSLVKIKRSLLRDFGTNFLGAIETCLNPHCFVFFPCQAINKGPILDCDKKSIPSALRIFRNA